MVAVVIMGMLTGENNDDCHCHPHPHPRYDSEGNYLGSLPDLMTARDNHACSAFTSDGEEVLSAHLINVVFQKKKVPMLFHYLLFFKQGLLVAGGYNRGYLSSTEIYLPSNNQWAEAKNLPRFHFAKASLYFIQNCF